MLLLLLCLPALAHTEKGPPTELLKKIFPSAEGFVTRDLKLSGATLRQHVEKRLGKKLAPGDLAAKGYVATVRGRSIGVAWMTDLPLGSKFADVVVGVDLQGKIVGVVVDHSPIPALAQPAFLDQFRGKGPEAPLSVGQDLKPAPGQKVTSQQLAQAVRKAVVVLNEAVVPHH